MSRRDGSDYEFLLTELAAVKCRLARIERGRVRPVRDCINEQEAIREVLQLDPVDDVDETSTFPPL